MAAHRPDHLNGQVKGMPNAQVTLVQIDNYGPWTATPRPRSEGDIQLLQAQLLADFAKFVRSQEGYPFYLRFDNMVGLTNGLDRTDHVRIQESIRNRYPITVSLSVAADPSPAVALATASANLQAAGSAQDESRRSVLCGGPITPDERTEVDVEIAHFDVIDATRTLTDELDSFDSFLHIMKGYLTLADYLYHHHDTLTFFMGGDNMVAVSPQLKRGAYEAAIDHVETAAELPLQVGIGQGATAHRAGTDAKDALEACRENDTRIETRPADFHGARPDR